MAEVARCLGDHEKPLPITLTRKGWEAKRASEEAIVLERRDNITRRSLPENRRVGKGPLLEVMGLRRAA